MQQRRKTKKKLVHICYLYKNTTHFVKRIDTASEEWKFVNEGERERGWMEEDYAKHNSFSHTFGLGIDGWMDVEEGEEKAANSRMASD